VAAVQAALEAQRAKVIELKSKRDQAQRLQRDAELARRSYDAAVNRANESVLDSGGPRESVSIVKAATPPALPSSPRVIANLVAALVIGLLAGVAAAFWRESRDRRLRLEEDVGHLLEQPLLGRISNGQGARRQLSYTSPQWEPT
jgi:succinoglycan biosynthesis transport protein ExoP